MEAREPDQASAQAASQKLVTLTRHRAARSHAPFGTTAFARRHSRRRLDAKADTPHHAHQKTATQAPAQPALPATTPPLPTTPPAAAASAAAAPALPPCLLLRPRRGRGLGPVDARRGRGDHHLHPAVQRRASLASGVRPRGAKDVGLLQQIRGGRLAESTVQRTTKDVGSRRAALRGLTPEPRRAWP